MTFSAISATARRDTPQSHALLHNQNLGLVYNVLAYGATGNGTSNDTSSIAAALTAATSSKGTVYLPPGTYLTDGLTVPASVTLAGAGRGASTLKRRSASSYAVVQCGSGARVHDLTINGNSLGSQGGNAEIDFASGSNITVDNVEITSWNGLGINAGAASNGRILNCLLSGTATPTTGSYLGIWFDSPTATTDLLISGCKISGTRINGIYGASSDMIMVVGNTFVDCHRQSVPDVGGMICCLGTNWIIADNILRDATGVGTTGIECYTVGGTISGNLVRNQTQDGIQCRSIAASTCANMSVIGNRVLGSSQWGIRFDNACSNITVVGNNCTNNTSGNITLGSGSGHRAVGNPGFTDV